ncbi:alpha/beta hydrolase family protein [Hydrogenophaga atypica]|uniref:Alpha/beta hydrolase family protein n=1 Tax=Hydrogenophaga atypica TaxID=249409 RepID=A0ABW2QPL5_9BURK
MGLRWVFHHALLRALRAPRLPHEPPIHQRALRGGTLSAHRLSTSAGKQLAAWLIRPNASASTSAPTVLVMHGWGANAAMMWPVVQPLVDTGHVVGLLDARCHGESDGADFTSLPRFAEDIATALLWLVQQPGVDAQRLALLGHSVGAGACLLHAAQGQPKVAAVVSLSAFAHPAEVMRRWLAEHHLPQRVVGQTILAHVQEVIGARFDDIAPIHTIAKLTTPVLLVHGRQDEAVPFSDAERLAEAAWDAGGYVRILAVDGPHDLREALEPHAHEIIDFLAAVWRRMATLKPSQATRLSDRFEHQTR